MEKFVNRVHLQELTKDHTLLTTIKGNKGPVIAEIEYPR